MSLTPQWLDELRARITLSGVISRTTRLTKAGHEFKACCPFHSEKSPSFTVNDAKGFYHCFGCGAHGDVIRWMTDQRGLSFMDAVKELASEAGLEMPAPDPVAAKRAEQQSGLHEVMAAAQAWFVERLASDEGAKARAYLATRGFDGHTVERFGFGYAPEGRQALKAALSQFPEEMLVEAGLRIAVEDKDPYDRFRGRLMLPIEDARGRVIAFGGRILDVQKTDAPKYLNSPETPLFDKGRTLYNLHRAGPASRQTGRMVVVEGYMDVIALAAAGFSDAVAPLGTALTERQIELLWRMVETPVLCFDGDAAGQRAAMRAVTRALPLLRPAHSLSIVRLPAGMDPDDLLRRDGAKALESLLAQPSSLLDLLWEHERDAAPLASPEDKAGLKARLMAHVDTITDPDIKPLYRRELGDRFSAYAFPKREERQWQPSGRPGSRPAPVSKSDPKSIKTLKAATSGGQSRNLAMACISGLIRYPAEIDRHAELILAARHLDERFGVLVEIHDSGGATNSEAVIIKLYDEGLTIPALSEIGPIPYPFLDDRKPDSQSKEALSVSLSKLIEVPQIERALDLATEQFNIQEQQRLRLRKESINSQFKALGPLGSPMPLS